MDAAGRAVLRPYLTEFALLRLTANLPACPIGMEACSGSHYLGRTLLAQGHEICLMPPNYVKRYVKSEKSRVSQCTSLWFMVMNRARTSSTSRTRARTTSTGAPSKTYVARRTRL